MQTNIIFLYGAPGSGKTTLAHELSQALDCPCLDTDDMIVQTAGCSIAQYFAEHGEPAFRDLETRILRSLADDSTAPLRVVALGGGTLLRPENRDFCEQHGVVFCLDTPPEHVLQRRLAQAPGSRPLGNKAQERAAHYASFPNRIADFFMLPDSLIVVGKHIAPALMTPARTVFDSTVARTYPHLASSQLAVIPSGEEHKTPETILNLWHAFASAGIGRKDSVGSCGGGVTSDVTGFAAATWMRGIAWRNFPTTLLAMVDASTGGKTGCDLPEGKNLAGAFHAPKLVVIDTDFLETLPEHEIISGRAEMLKHAIIGGLNPICTGIPTPREIADNLAVKITIVREDPLETLGKRILLNCGHTVGHALETATNYAYSHGEAVAIGCVEEAKLAVRLNLAPVTWPEELAKIFADAGLPTTLPDGITFQSLIPLMHGDKKRIGNDVVFALPLAWGNVQATQVTIDK